MRLLVVDDDKTLLTTVSQYLASQFECEVSTASDGYDAINVIRSFVPDIVLLDAAIPGIDGLGVLDELVKLPLHRIPRVVLSAPGAWVFIRNESEKRGASCFLPRPFTLDQAYAAVVKSMQYDPYPVLRTQLSTIVSRLLRESGVSPQYAGYRFLRDAILYTYYDAGAVDSIMKNLYARVALENRRKPVNVERCIRHAIETAWSRNSPARIEQIFGNTLREDTGKPTNAQFIALMADKLRVEFKETASSARRI